MNTSTEDRTDHPDDVPLFPAPAPDALADPDTARALLRPVLDDLARVVAGIGAGELARPTPCRDFDVAALRDHVLGWLEFFGAAFADPARRGPRPEPEAFRAAGDVTGVVRTAAARLDAALAGGVLGGEVVLSASRMTGPAALGMVLGEYVIHGHDLAVATGQPWTPPEPAVSTAHAFLTGVVVPEYRGADGGFFAEEILVAPDAPALDRLLGFAGRDSHWTPPAA